MRHIATVTAALKVVHAPPDESVFVVHHTWPPLAHRGHNSVCDPYRPIVDDKAVPSSDESLYNSKLIRLVLPLQLNIQVWSNPRHRPVMQHGQPTVLEIHTDPAGEQLVSDFLDRHLARHTYDQ